jgi:poly-gamma-glutamate synthesis protein (capsule biosynthesis protein)
MAAIVERPGGARKPGEAPDGDDAGGRSCDIPPVRRIAAVVAALLACGGKPVPADSKSSGRAELWFGGDVHLGPGGARALAPLAAAMRPADGIVNLEGPIDPRGDKDGGVVREPGALRLFNGAGTAKELAGSGIVAASIANNHADDAGPEGQVATAQALVRAGISPFGGKAQVAVLARGDLQIALAAYDLGAGVPPGLAAELAVTRQSGDVLAVSFHTTGQPLYLPEPPLREAADIALAAGAAVVVAHGTHSLAGAERRGAAVVAWGLGNVAFACDCTDEREALVLRVTLGKGGVESAALVPIDAGLRGAQARVAADPAPVLDLLTALGVSGTRGADRLELSLAPAKSAAAPASAP